MTTPNKFSVALAGLFLCITALAKEPVVDVPVVNAPVLQPSTTPITLDASRRAELISLVRQDCGSCHGLTLQGGLGPPLLPATLQDKPADSLKWVILQGRPGTAMPPWQRFLTEAEAQWLVLNLQKGFPREY